jgi:outer membrane receptor for ferrienterochelin and colicins
MRKNDLTASLALRYINEERWGGEMQWQPKFRGGDSVYGESINTNRAELIGTMELSKNLNADISYNYHLQDSYYGKIKYYASQQVLFAQLRWTRTIARHFLLAGIPFRYTYYDDNSPATAQTNGINKPANSFLPGIFLQDEFKVSERLTTLAGLRYDHNNEHGNIFTPRLSFKYAPDAANTLRLSAGNGYRVVNLFTEDHAALTGARDVVIAAALKPERSWNGNINYTKIIRHSKGFINLDGSIFYTYFTNKIVADFITDPNKIIYDNLKGYAVSKGITLNTDVNFTTGLKINAGATLMDVYQMDKDANAKKIKTPQLFAPKLSGTFTVSYTLRKSKLLFDLTGRVTGPMYLPTVPGDFRAARSPLYSIINLQLTKTFDKGLEIYTGVKNLFNFLPKDPLLHPDDPFDKPGGKYFDNNGVARPDTNPYGYVFDPSYNYATVQGAKVFAGIRWTIK